MRVRIDESGHDELAGGVHDRGVGVFSNNLGRRPHGRDPSVLDRNGPSVDDGESFVERDDEPTPYDERRQLCQAGPPGRTYPPAERLSRRTSPSPRTYLIAPNTRRFRNL